MLKRTMVLRVGLMGGGAKLFGMCWKRMVWDFFGSVVKWLAWVSVLAWRKMGLLYKPFIDQRGCVTVSRRLICDSRVT